MPPEIIPTDFWGVVIPTWVGAIGTILAAGIGVVALFRSNSAVGSVKTLRDGAIAEAHQTPAPTSTGNVHASTPPVHIGTPTVEWRGESRPPGEPNRRPWIVSFPGSNRVQFENSLEAPLTLTELVASDGLALTADFSLPAEVPPHAMFKVIMHRMIGGPAVRSITLTATDASGESVTQVFYV